MVECTVCESHFSSTDALIIVPLAFEHLAIAIVAGSLAVSPMIAIATLVVATVLEHDLDSAVKRQCPGLESTVQNLIFSGV